MGIYSEYLDRGFDWATLSSERKKQLKRISQLRSGRDILVFSAAMTKDAPIGIDYEDLVPIQDQLSNLKSDKIDIIIETPGGYAEIVEDIVGQIRNRFSEVTMIIPGHAKSAGTIMVMAGDEIMMSSGSALGPIDAQIVQGGKRFSAHAFLEGLDKIKEEVRLQGYLNKAYVPILQNISPGEIQDSENSLNFAKVLVTGWLSEYKFKFWDKHSSTGAPVTKDDKIKRANEIAETLCNHGKWLTHGRSITIKNLREMRLKVTDYAENKDLNDAITRYYTLLKMSFDTTNIFKIYETPDSQIIRHVTPQVNQTLQEDAKRNAKKVVVDYTCPQCKTKSKIQANISKDVKLDKNAHPFPKDNIFICPNCSVRNDLSSIRRQIESQIKKKIL